MNSQTSRTRLSPAIEGEAEEEEYKDEEEELSGEGHGDGEVADHSDRPAYRRLMFEKESLRALMNLSKLVNANECFDEEDRAEVSKAMERVSKRVVKAQRLSDREGEIHPKIAWMRQNSLRRIELLHEAEGIDFEGRHSSLGEYFVAKQDKLTGYIRSLEEIMMAPRQKPAEDASPKIDPTVQKKRAGNAGRAGRGR
mgnify:CR=1 FL=1